MITLFMLPLKSRFGADPLGLFAGKWRFPLLGGTEAINEGDTEGLDWTVREGRILLLPLKAYKLLGFGGELVQRIFSSRTNKQ